MTCRLRRQPLTLIILLGFVLRLVYLAISNHVYYPDELYQSLEQAFRLVNGFGILPWDFAFGLRSYVFPLILAIPLGFSKIIGINDPSMYRLFPQIFLIILSLLPIIASYLLVMRFSKNRQAALFAAYGAAVWYELVYFSSRALTETISLYLMSCAVIALHGKNPKHILGSCFLTSSILFRPQLFLSGIFVGYYSLQQLHHRIRFLLGGSIAILIFGFVDLIFIGKFLGHIVNNYQISYASGISEIFGEKVWWYYFAALTASSCGLWLLAFLTITNKKSSVLWYAFISTILLHTLILHKEYRFILITIPIWIILVSINLAHHIKTPSNKRRRQIWMLIAGIFSIISILGIINRLPYQSIAYGQPLLLNDPNIAVYNKLAKENEICGVYDATRNWVYTPGYNAINKNVPLYSADYPPPNPNVISHYIFPDDKLQLAGFTKLFSTSSYTVNVAGKPTILPGYTVYKKIIGSCVRDKNYSSYRSFTDVDRLLKSVDAKQLIMP